jgi:hypothetical protein
LVGDAPGKAPCGDVFMKNTIRSGSGYGNGLRRTVLTTENTAVVAPMPSASAASAAKLNARCCPSMRSEYLRSWRKRSMETRREVRPANVTL